MATELPAIPVDEFFRQASWQCVRTHDVKAVADALGLPHLEPAETPTDLADVVFDDMPCLIVSDGTFTWIFGNAMGLKGARRLSTEFGEALAFHCDDVSGTHLAERSRLGRSLRRVYASQTDDEYQSQGDPGPGEPRVGWLEDRGDAARLGLTSGDVLHFARAWGVDPQGVLTTAHDALWATRRAPSPSPPERSTPRTVASAVMFTLALLLTVAAVGLFFVFDQPKVALEVCARQPLCATCVSCASSDPHPCAELRRACDADPACVALSTCLADCLGAAEVGLATPPPDAPACFDRCRDTHADGVEAWCAFGACAYADACATACADPIHGALACE